MVMFIFKHLIQFLIKIKFLIFKFKKYLNI